MTNEERHIAVLNRMLENMDVYDSVQPTTERKKAIKAAIKALEQTTWTPVSERLPEEYGEYLVTWKTNDSSTPFISVCEYETSYEYDVEKHRFNGEWLVDDYILVHSDYEVIAWMPLPRPYKESEI